MNLSCGLPFLTGRVYSANTCVGPFRVRGSFRYWHLTVTPLFSPSCFVCVYIIGKEKHGTINFPFPSPPPPPPPPTLTKKEKERRIKELKKEEKKRNRRLNVKCIILSLTVACFVRVSFLSCLVFFRRSCGIFGSCGFSSSLTLFVLPFN